MSDVLGEVRYALRRIRKDKAFSLPVLLTLAFCLAANAAVFTVVHFVLLRPLPFPQSDRLVWITNSYPKVGVLEAANAVPDYEDRRKSVPAFEDVALFLRTGHTLGLEDGAQRVSAMSATPSLFRLLRARPLRGRLLEEGDGRPGQDHEVVLSYGLWLRLFAGRDDAIGRQLRIDGIPYTVVGVAPRDFLFVDPEVTFWLPLAITPQDLSDDNRGNNYLDMVARLRRGTTLEQARQQLRALDAANLERFPKLRAGQLASGYTSVVMPLRERLVQGVRGTLSLLWGGVLCVLMIGCVNVLNLALARGTTRWREVAVRQALGATNWRLLRQRLAESLILTSLAGVAAIGLAVPLVRALSASAAGSVLPGNAISIGAPTILLMGASSLLIAFLLAGVPLARGARARLTERLNQDGRGGTTSRSARSLRRTLTSTQVAFAFLLLLGAGLLLASFQELMHVRPGFDPEKLLTAKISLPSSLYPRAESLIAFSARALERIRALPGVEAASLGDAVPFAGNYSDNNVRAYARPTASGDTVYDPTENGVTPGYFAALRIPVKRGRVIDERDTPTSPPVIVVDQRLADELWPGEDPVGRHAYFFGNSPPGTTAPVVTVVGVVGEVKQRGLASPDERVGAYYFPYAQHPFPYAQDPRRTLTLVVRTGGEPLRLAPAVRRTLGAIDSNVPFYDVRTMDSRVETSVAERRTSMRLATAFGLAALLLAAFGLYGVLAYQVTQRTREIGIRIALGSRRSQVFQLVLGEGVVLLAIGLLLGAAGLFALRRVLASELYGITPFEPAVCLAVTILIGLVALAACALPARRAARIDPMVALSR